MRKVIIVQARMTSTRLPGKILKKVLNKPLLAYQVERLLRVRLADNVIIATTENKEDNVIVDFCKELSLPYFRGSEEDVLSRYHGTALEHEADVVVRVTSDCPLIDPSVIDSVIGFYIDNYPKYDYVSNTLERTYPRGMDTEVFSFKALELAHRLAKTAPEREHVTAYLYRNPEIFGTANVTFHEDQSRHRWTVDTADDFELIKRIIEGLYPVNPHFSLEDALSLLENNPDWFHINVHVEQKLYGQ
ncbi:MAG: acylneuraminate cytidylyltransferase [Peptococcaceae bacterium BICA1-7]|nr:MAG: acylneuraminate cytidylyltransferase [Peptococcaceae bacterium BICA1-7]HBV96585.1 acylneuraminate cytidylyltransferase [Desulfotomaculum sp.]